MFMSSKIPKGVQLSSFRALVAEESGGVSSLAAFTLRCLWNEN